MEQETRFCEHCSGEIPRRDGEYVSQYKRRRYCSSECRMIGANARRKEPQEPSYATLHYRVYRLRGRAAEQLCEHCGEPAKEWATVHDTDGLNPMTDYISLCRKCHLIYDDINYRKVVTRRAQTGYTRTPEQSEASRQGLRRMWASFTPEERSQIMRDRWEVHRAKQAARDADLSSGPEADRLSQSAEGTEGIDD